MTIQFVQMKVENHQFGKLLKFPCCTVFLKMIFFSSKILKLITIYQNNIL